jgi:hypothetical protein
MVRPMPVRPSDEEERYFEELDSENRRRLRDQL